MAYNLYAEQGGVTATLVSPTISGSPILALSTGNMFQADAGLFSPFPGVLSTSTATIQVNDRTYLSYIGRVNCPKTTCTVAYLLKTQMTATVAYGEMAIYIGKPNVGAVPTLLTLAGSVDCSGSGQFTHAPGALTATISLTGVVGGSDLWLATASSTTGTAAQFDALVIDRWATGLFAVSKNSAQPSLTASFAAGDLTLNSTVSGPAAFVFI